MASTVCRFSLKQDESIPLLPLYTKMNIKCEHYPVFQNNRHGVCTKLTAYVLNKIVLKADFKAHYFR